MRALGVIAAVIAAAAAAACVRGAFTSGRPRDLAYALAAPLLILVMIAALVIAFAPDAL
jgi:hypothetical protein